MNRNAEARPVVDLSLLVTLSIHSSRESWCGQLSIEESARPALVTVTKAAPPMAALVTVTATTASPPEGWQLCGGGGGQARRLRTLRVGVHITFLAGLDQFGS